MKDGKGLKKGKEKCDTLNKFIKTTVPQKQF